MNTYRLLFATLLVLILLAVAAGVSLWQGLIEAGVKDKTLWNWLQVFGAPLAAAIIAWFITLGSNQAGRRAELERELNTERARESALRAYLDSMAQLVLVNGLPESTPGDSVRAVALAQTHAVLATLDGARKGIVLRFLKLTRLIGPENEVVSLEFADLKGVELYHADLQGANLFGAELSGAYLFEADLSQANLSLADLTDSVLRGADLTSVDLRGANLRGADLRDSDLSNADLHSADLRGADLRDCDLSNADLSKAQLAGADLRDAILEHATVDLCELRPADLGEAEPAELTINDRLEKQEGS